MQSNRYWFRPKNYGYGFFPISWEGWLMTLGVFLTVLILAYIDGFFTPSGPTLREAALFLWQLGMTMAVFFLFARPRTDGPLEWHWGGPLIPQATRSAPTAAKRAPRAVAKPAVRSTRTPRTK